FLTEEHLGTSGAETALPGPSKSLLGTSGANNRSHLPSSANTSSFRLQYKKDHGGRFAAPWSCRSYKDSRSGL
ncbi:hypothetical protein, partial [Paenibacillus lactis]|uniref:hypothetical protein n=1 Tax=Paenibacillus lactis TaxID=228574 RepID=UPI0023F2429C